MRKPKTAAGAPPQLNRGFSPPKAVAAAPMTPKPSPGPKQGGTSRIRNLGEYAHPAKKKRK